MLALALLPLAAYFAFLTSLHFRKTPTVLNGSLDFTLIAWGLCGLITLGPGRLLIPLYVFTAWGLYTWIFWFGFYFALTYFLGTQFKNRIVVYHGQRELVLPPFFTLVRLIDPKAEWSGHVLSLHSLGVQWSIICDKFGGYLLFVPTNPYWKNPHQEMLQQQLTALCQTLVMPKRKIRWGWLLLTIGLFCFAGGLLIRDFPVLVQQFYNLWLLH